MTNYPRVQFQRKVSLLRIIDLSSALAEIEDFPKNARKEDLQKRVLELLNSKQISDQQKTLLKTAIEQAYSKM
jgi:hypothetical protein